MTAAKGLRMLLFGVLLGGGGGLWFLPGRLCVGMGSGGVLSSKCVCHMVPYVSRLRRKAGVITPITSHSDSESDPIRSRDSLETCVFDSLGMDIDSELSVLSDRIGYPPNPNRSTTKARVFRSGRTIHRRLAIYVFLVSSLPSSLTISDEPKADGNGTL
jgi:hypothetical protein